MAGIFTDGVHARAAGRGGLGAVMGSKQLKALVVGGDLKIPVSQFERLHVSVRQSIPDIKKKTRAFSDFGTAGGLLFAEEIGDLPIRNWAWGTWKEGAIRISGESLKEQMFKSPILWFLFGRMEESFSYNPIWNCRWGQSMRHWQPWDRTVDR
jgi:aldehyde:ferredoxin oxidoreductase